MDRKQLHSRIQPKLESNYYHQPLDNPQLKATLKTLQAFIQSSYGHHGNLKTIQNNVGGHVTITSTSSRIFQVLNVSRPIVKLIVTAAIQHLQIFADAGLFTPLLCTQLINSSLELAVHRGLLVEIYQHLLDISVEYLASSNAACVVNIDFTQLKTLLDIATSVIRSKLGCFLFGESLERISQLTVQLFLLTLENSSTVGNIEYLCVAGTNPTSSLIIQGLLFQQLNQQNKATLRHWSLQKKEFVIKTVLFSTSLSGDSEEFTDASYVLSSSDASLDNSIIKKVLKMCEMVIKDNVSVVMCQKVVHPSVKHFLQDHRVVVIDRLGDLCTTRIVQLAGGKCLSSVNIQPVAEDYGNLSNLSYLEIGHKLYIHLENQSSPVHTFVLCNQHEESLQETKVACQAAITSLRLLMTKPAALYGGGCWETHLASYIRKQVSVKCDQLVHDLECSKQQLLEACNVFAHSLERVGIATSLKNGGLHRVDSCQSHHWEETADRCCCGLMTMNAGLSLFDISKTGNVLHHPSTCEPSCIQKDNLVLDAFPARLNALQVAVNTANTVLGISNLILSQN